MGGKSKNDIYLGIGAVALFTGLIGSIYQLGKSVRHSHLDHNNKYCTSLLKKANGNKEISDFVNNEITITSGPYKRKTCGEIVEEYSKINLVK